LTSTGRRTERRTRPDPHATVSRACVRRLRLELRRQTAFPSSATFGHPLSPARAGNEEEASPTETSRPRPSFRQRPAKRAAFQKTGMPLSVTTREGIERGRFNPSGLRAGSLAHAAHTFSPSWGECFVWALQVSQCGHPRSVTVPSADGSRVQSPLLLPETRLGLTTQARR